MVNKKYQKIIIIAFKNIWDITHAIISLDIVMVNQLPRHKSTTCEPPHLHGLQSFSILDHNTKELIS